MGGPRYRPSSRPICRPGPLPRAWPRPWSCSRPVRARRTSGRRPSRPPRPSPADDTGAPVRIARARWAGFAEIAGQRACTAGCRGSWPCTAGGSDRTGGASPMVQSWRTGLVTRGIQRPSSPRCVQRGDRRVCPLCHLPAKIDVVTSPQRRVLCAARGPPSAGCFSQRSLCSPFRARSPPAQMPPGRHLRPTRPPRGPRLRPTPR